MPMTSCAPRFADRNASPVTQAGIARPERKKSSLVRTERRSSTPMPSTNAEYSPITAKSIPATWVIAHLPQWLLERSTSG